MLTTRKKRNAKQSVRYVKSGFTLTNGILKIAKNKDPLDIRWSRKFSGEPTSVTISRDCSERYFVSFAIEEPVYTLPKLGSAIGIDVGIKDVCVTSEGFRSGSFQYTRKLKYKAEWYGRELLEIDRWFPSSKRCSCCGHIHNGLKLSDRIWWCPSCKKMLDRDINAAKNILTVGLAELAFGESGKLGNNNLLQSCSL